MPCWSKNKAEWGDATESDALCWFMGTENHDYDFRTRLFGQFPDSEQHQPGFNAIVGQSYSMRCIISSTAACYSINGELYASATFDEG